MSDIVQTPAIPTKRGRSRVFDYLIVLAIIGAVIAGEFYQEEVSSFFKLRMWDRAAPGRVAAQFLEAAQKGDQKGADACIKSSSLTPLIKDGKWVGYFVVVMAARMDIMLDDLVPQGSPAPANVEFKTTGNGAALVTIPNSKGKAVTYRLEMKADGWKITDIRGGCPAAQEKRPVGGASKKQAQPAPH